jgi:hypothetical protein
MGGSVIDRLQDRQAIGVVVVRYATGIDTRDWALYRSCFTDPCEIDFSSWSGRPATVMPSQAWAEAVRASNGGFEATQHLSTNHVVTFGSDDEATCVSYVQAQHWFGSDRLAELGRPSRQPSWCTLGGFYTNSLVRTDEGWRIHRCQLTVTWVSGDRSVFELARSSSGRG